MSTSNKQIVQGFLDMFNRRSLEEADQYFTEDTVYLSETYITSGVWLKAEDGKAVVESVAEWGPSARKLQPGDEILSVQEGNRVYDTLEALLYAPWGFHLGVSIQVQARRDGEVFECEITPVVDKARRSPFPPSRLTEALRTFYDNNPEYHYETEYMIEEGDIVACIGISSGINKKFNNRPYAFSEAVLFGIANGKITFMFDVHNMAFELQQLGHWLLPEA